MRASPPAAAAATAARGAAGEGNARDGSCRAEAAARGARAGTTGSAGGSAAPAAGPTRSERSGGLCLAATLRTAPAADGLPSWRPDPRGLSSPPCSEPLPLPSLRMLLLRPLLGRRGGGIFSLLPLPSPPATDRDSLLFDLPGVDDLPPLALPPPALGDRSPSPRVSWASTSMLLPVLPRSRWSYGTHFGGTLPACESRSGSNCRLCC